MSKMCEYVKHCIDELGYLQEDFISLGDVHNRTEGRPTVLLLEVDRVTIPVELSTVQSAMLENGAEYLLLHDSDIVLIFQATGEEVREIGSLPPVTLSEAKAAKLNADHLYDIMKELRYAHGCDAVLEFVALSSAVQSDQDLGSMLRSSDEGAVKSVLESVGGRTGISFSCLSDLPQTRVSEIAGLFDGVDLTPSSVLGEVCCRFLSMYTSRRTLPKAVYDCMCEFIAPGAPVLCCSHTMHVAASDCDRQVFMNCHQCGYGPQEENAVRIIGFVSGSGCELVQDLDGRSFDSIILAPMLGARVSHEQCVAVGTDMRPSTCEQLSVLESLRRLSRRGRMILLASEGFLFSMRNREIRQYIQSRYRISAILRIGDVTPLTHVGNVLIVIDDDLPGDVLVRTSPVSGDIVAVTREMCSALSDHADAEGCVRIPQSELGTDWMESMYVRPACDGEPVSSFYEVLRGASISPRSYCPQDSPAGVPYLRMSNILEGTISLDGAVRVPSSEARFIARRGDVVVSAFGAIGRMAMVEDEVFVPSAQTLVLRPKDPDRADDLYRRLSSESVRSQMLDYATGPGMKHLSARAMSRILM